MKLLFPASDCFNTSAMRGVHCASKKESLLWAAPPPTGNSKRSVTNAFS